MNKLFDLNSPVMLFLSKMANMMILSLLWSVFCIPVVTIGAATTAMYSVQLRLLRDQDDAIVLHFWNAFRSEFGKSTVLMLLCGGILAFIAIDLLIIFVWIPGMPNLAKIAMVVIAAIALMCVGYVFPLTAQFENTLPNILKNAVCLTLFFLPQSIAALLIGIAPVVFLYVFQADVIKGLFVWNLIGVAVIENLRMRVFMRVFRHFISPEQKDSAAMGQIQE